MKARFVDNRLAKVLAWGVYLMVLVAVGRDVTSRQMPLSLTVLFVSALLFALLKPRFAMVIAIVSALSMDWLTFVVPAIPGRAVWIQEVMLLALGAATLMRGSKRGFRRSSIDGVILTLLAVGAISALINASSPIVSILGFRNYFKHLLLFFALINLDIPEQFRRKLMHMLMWIAGLQVPIAFIQFLVRTQRSGDTIGGTLGSYASGTLTIFLLMMSGIALGWYLARQDARGQYALLATFLLLPAALNETKVLFFAAPLLIAVVSRRGLSLRAGRTALILTLFATLFFGAFQLYDAFYASGSGEDVFSADYLKWYLLTERVEGGAMNRIPAAAFAVREISSDPITALIGHGPGSASDSTFVYGVGPIYSKYGDLRVDSTFVERFTLEYGLAGVALFVWLMILLAHAARVAYRKAVDPFWKGVVIGYEGMLALMLLLGVYTGTFTIDPLSVSFWTVSAFVVAIALESDDREAITGY